MAKTEETTKPVAMVMDKVTARSQSNAKAVATYFKTYLNDGNKLQVVSNDGSQSQFRGDLKNVSFDAALLHDNDKELLKGHEKRFMAVIRYTGGDPQNDTGNEIWIRKPLTSNSPLTEQDAKTLHDFVSQWKAEQKMPPLPDLLRPVVSLQVLPALSILCQGYLALHVNLETGKFDDAVKEEERCVCTEALKTMGWLEVKDSSEERRRGILREMQANKDDPELARRPEWWAETFDGEDFPLEEEAKKEWGSSWISDGQVAKALIYLIKSDTDCEIPAALVAKTYLAIAERIENFGA
jgi:hypothetical protein